MRTWSIYLVRRRPWGDVVVRAYTPGSSPPGRWRSRWVGTYPAPTRRVAELIATAVGWKAVRGLRVTA